MIRKLVDKVSKEVNENKIALLLLLLMFLIKLIFILSLNNTDWEPDSYMHFLELNTIYKDFPNNLSLGLGVWTKPLYAYLFGIPVTILNTNSFLIVQVINLIIFSLISYFVYKLVLKFVNNRLIGLLSIILSTLSLTLFKSSTSSLTEPIFTLTLVLGFYFLSS